MAKVEIDDADDPMSSEKFDGKSPCMPMAVVQNDGIATLNCGHQGRDLRIGVLMGNRIGSGGSGVVRPATGGDGIEYAVKFLVSSDPKDVIRFNAEINALYKAEGIPRVARIIANGMHEGQPYYIMPRYKGKTLKEKDDDDPTSLDEIIENSLALFDSIHALHDKGIYNRDIKTENIIRSRNANGAIEWTLVDFGLTETGQTQNHNDAYDVDSFPTPEGTWGYYPPENNEYDFPPKILDLYGMGVVVLEMLERCPDGELSSAVKCAIGESIKYRREYGRSKDQFKWREVHRFDKAAILKLTEEKNAHQQMHSLVEALNQSLIIVPNSHVCIKEEQKRELKRMSKQLNVLQLSLISFAIVLIIVCLQMIFGSTTGVDTGTWRTSSAYILLPIGVILLIGAFVYRAFAKNEKAKDRKATSQGDASGNIINNINLPPGSFRAIVSTKTAKGDSNVQLTVLPNATQDIGGENDAIEGNNIARTITSLNNAISGNVIKPSSDFVPALNAVKSADDSTTGDERPHEVPRAVSTKSETIPSADQGKRTGIQGAETATVQATPQDRLAEAPSVQFSGECRNDDSTAHQEKAWEGLATFRQSGIGQGSNIVQVDSKEGNDSPTTHQGKTWEGLATFRQIGIGPDSEADPDQKAQLVPGSSDDGNERPREAPQTADAQFKTVSPADHVTATEIQNIEAPAIPQANDASHAPSLPQDRLINDPRVRFVIVGPKGSGKTELRRTMLIYSDRKCSFSSVEGRFHYIGMTEVHNRHTAALGPCGLPINEFSGHIYLHDAKEQELNGEELYKWIGHRAATPAVESRTITIYVDRDTTQQVAIDTPGEEWDKMLVGRWKDGRFVKTYGVNWLIRNRRMVIAGITGTHGYSGLNKAANEFLHRLETISRSNRTLSSRALEGTASITMISISHDSLMKSQVSSGVTYPHEEFLSWLLLVAIVSFNYTNDELNPKDTGIMPALSVVITNRHGELNAESHNGLCLRIDNKPSLFMERCIAGIAVLLDSGPNSIERNVLETMLRRIEKFHAYPVRGWNMIDENGNRAEINDRLIVDKDGKSIRKRTAVVTYLDGAFAEFDEDGDAFSERFISKDGRRLVIHKQFVCEGIPYLMHRILNTYRSCMTSMDGSRA